MAKELNLPSQLGQQRFYVEEPTFVRGRPPALPDEVGVKIRSAVRVVRARVQAARYELLEVHAERPLRDVTAGQAAVFYRAEEVFGWRYDRIVTKKSS